MYHSFIIFYNKIRLGIDCIKCVRRACNARTCRAKSATMYGESSRYSAIWSDRVSDQAAAFLLGTFFPHNAEARSLKFRLGLHGDAYPTDSFFLPRICIPFIAATAAITNYQWHTRGRAERVLSRPLDVVRAQGSTWARGTPSALSICFAFAEKIADAENRVLTSLLRNSTPRPESFSLFPFFFFRHSSSFRRRVSCLATCCGSR